jgi:N-methylhydantoinase B
MLTPGSGGFGSATERNPRSIGRDLRDGYVSASAATRDYGITDPDDLLKSAAAEDKA